MFFSSYAHAVGSSARQFLSTPTFLPGTHQQASVLCFPACFSFQKHTTCVFSLTFHPKNTLFSPAHTNKLPVCVFPLAFLPKNTRHVFFCLLFLSYTHFSSHDQFSPHNLSISFRGGGFPLANFCMTAYCTKNHRISYDTRWF